MGAVRTKTTLSTSLRETAICRVAVLNKAWYEWGHHAPLLEDCVGVEKEHLDAILNSPPYSIEGEEIDEKHSAVMAYTDVMTLDVQVPDPVIDRLKKNFNDKEVVEITATIAAYNCVSRFLVALDVGEKNGETAASISQ